MRAAAVEAPVVKAALASLKAGRVADEIALPPADAVSRKDLRTNTQWLLPVAAAYTNRVGRVAADGQPEAIGA